MSYRFGPFHLDPVAGRLLRDELEIELQPKAMALLGTFVQHPDRLFSRSELLDEVWPDVVVSDHSLSQALFKLRQALEVPGDATRWVQTVHGRGYRFVGEVVVEAPLPQASGAVDGFVGRAEELARLDALWEEGARGIAVVGPGGQGKTRLAGQHQAQQTRWPEARFVGLVSSTSRADAVGAVAQALGVPLQASEPAEQVGRALKARGPMLIVLDNLESVREGMEALIGRWATAAPEVRWLLTSRERATIPGFRELPLGGLQPGDALGLFLARAEDRSVRLEARWHDAIRAIGEHLEGQPLGIELAVSRVPLLDPEALLERLRAQRPALGTLPGATPRHQSMHATVKWSWDLLDETAQQLLLALSLFRGPFTARQVDAAFGGDALDTLAVLTDSFLVRPMTDAPGRLRLPEPVRDFLATLSPDPGAVERFVDAMDALAREPSPPWIDLPNLRAALEHTDRAKRRVRIGAKVARMLTGRAQPTEALKIIDELPTEGVDERLLDEVLRVWADAGSYIQQDAMAFEPLQEAAARASERGDHLSAAKLLAKLSHRTSSFGEQEAAVAAGEEAMAAAERAGDLEWLGAGAFRTAAALLYVGDTARATKVVARGIAAMRGHHAPRRRARLYDLAGTLHAHEARAEEALASFERAEELLEESGELASQYTVQMNRSSALQELGRFEEALQLQDALYGTLRRHGLWVHMDQVLTNRSVTLMHLDRLDEAWADLTEAAGLSGRGATEILVSLNKTAVACLRGAHADAVELARATLAAAGEHHVVEAATRVWLALAQLGLGDEASARQTLEATSAYRDQMPGMVRQSLDVVAAALDGSSLVVDPKHHPLAHLTARAARRARSGEAALTEAEG